MTKTPSSTPFFRGGQGMMLAVSAVLLLVQLPGARAQQTSPLGAAPEEGSSRQEVQQFCGNIVDAARDQRYLLQKQELEKLQADVDARIGELEKRRAEYESWLQKRNAFIAKARTGLVDIYRTGKPQEVAAQFNEMNINIAAAIIMQLPARQSSLILSEMDTQKAAMVASIMASAADPNTSKDPS